MIDFNKCHPIKLDDLVRIGNEYDGGYILSERQIGKTGIVLSFGVRDDWTFEEDFSRRKEVRIYSYDYSTKDLLFASKKLTRTCAAIVYHILRLNGKMVKRHFNHYMLSKNFYNFFDNKSRFFVPKFIEQYDDEQNICFDTIFKELGSIDDLSVFLKMDIEGAEYLCLPQLMPYVHKLNGMVIEFHNLAVADTKFEMLLDEFAKQFYVSHVHGNNFVGLIYKTNIPSVLEMTFINKSLVDEKVVLSNKNYPIEGLDAPCNKFKADYKIHW
ncbi:MAG: FkbM family methyltransferase [Bacteroidales bacterium]|jgi:hypothetical protein|nr:FkbM family methyltransferase [Bacteroidales bacterium]